MSLSKEAYTRIREAIVSGELEFGERLSEVQIAEALGMSKAPVRTAFFELRDKRLVTIVPQAGTYVFSPSREDVREMSTFRAVLETAALRLSMQAAGASVLATLHATIKSMEGALRSADWKQYEAADMAFHQAFIRNSGNSYLPQAYDLTASGIEALRVCLQRGAGDYREQSFAEHQLIVQHLEAGDLEKAAQALEAHILVINEAELDLPSKSRPRTKALSRSLDEYKRIFR